MDCEIKTTLINNLYFFVKNLFENSKDVKDFLNSLYEIYIISEIDINFDSDNFYITRNICDKGIKIDQNLDLKLLIIIQKLIEEKLMLDNIKNNLNKIHFRLYKYNSNLDNKNGELRKNIFFVTTNFIKIDIIFKFLVEKRIEVLNLLKFQVDNILLKKQNYRLEEIINFLKLKI